MWNDTDAAWERLGRINPYYGISGYAPFMAAAHDGPEREWLFRSGENYVAQVFALITESLAPDFAPRRALDFGCGVGRLLLPLARRAGEVVGIDVAAPMREAAQQNARTAGLTNITVCQSTDDLATVEGSFDFIHSFIVLQHIPVRRGIAIMKALVDRLSENGVGALHFTYADTKSVAWRAAYGLCKWVPGLHKLTNIARGRPVGRSLMQMNNYPLNELFLVLQSKGCCRVSVRFSEHSGHLGVLICFQRRTLPSL